MLRKQLIAKQCPEKMLYYDNYILYIIFCILCITCSMFVIFITFSGYCSVTLFVTVFWYFQSLTTILSAWFSLCFVGYSGLVLYYLKYIFSFIFKKFSRYYIHNFKIFQVSLLYYHFSIDLQYVSLFCIFNICFHIWLKQTHSFEK